MAIVQLGPIAPLTKEERDLDTRRQKIEDEIPLYFHQCADLLPTAKDLPKDAKERQVWTCPGTDKASCGAKYRLHFQRGLKIEEPGKAPVDEQQVTWVRIS